MNAARRSGWNCRCAEPLTGETDVLPSEDGRFAALSRGLEFTAGASAEAGHLPR
jgi:hypothetical protein